MDVRKKLVEIVCDVLEDGCVGHCNHPPCWKVTHAVDGLIAHGVTVQEWISVKDRLPVVKEPVLVYGANGITIDWLEDYGEQGLRWGNLCCGSYNPKYWQPFPQPPKGE